MHLLQFETWRLRPDTPPFDYESHMKGWLHYVNDTRESLFKEFVGAKYYEFVDHGGMPTGQRAMIFEYDSLAARKVYRKRKLEGRQQRPNPYDPLWHAEPSQFFDPQSVNMEFMQPQLPDMWFDYTGEKRVQEQKRGVNPPRVIEYQTWHLAEDCSMERYEAMLHTWFGFVMENKVPMFDEWVSARYYRRCDQNGNPTGVYVMLFEYDSLDGFHAYKARKLHSYTINDGVYAPYAANDPWQFFDQDTVSVDLLVPRLCEHWFTFPGKGEL